MGEATIIPDRRTCYDARVLRAAVVLSIVIASPAAGQDAAIYVPVPGAAGRAAMARVDGGRWSAACARPANAHVAPVEAVTPVARFTSTWRLLEPVIARLFDGRARRENVSPGALASVAMQIESVHGGAAVNGGQPYYFRASKTIPDTRGDVDLDEDGDVDPPGELRVDVSGWLRRTAARVDSLGTNATLSWEQIEDRPASGTLRPELLPLGVADVDGRRVWVMRGRSAASTWYSLYDVGADGVRMLLRSDRSRC